MSKIKLTSDAPGYLKVWEIEEQLLEFEEILDTKYKTIDFVFWFCFRALNENAINSGWKSKVTFFKSDNALSFDLIMPEADFIPYKKDIEMQKRIMGRYFFPYFSETIIKYSKKLTALKPVSGELIVDMESFLKKIRWLGDK